MYELASKICHVYREKVIICTIIVSDCIDNEGSTMKKSKLKQRVARAKARVMKIRIMAVSVSLLLFLGLELFLSQAQALMIW